MERLFALEIEFHRKLRCEAPGTQDTAARHTSYVSQAGYEPLMKRLGRVAARDIERMSQSLSLSSDPRDVMTARVSLTSLLSL